jgi:hypothetical protein
VYLHYDYMIASDHTDAPDPKQIQKVVDAYAKHGIDLVIDPEHTAIPEHQVIAFHTPTAQACTGVADAVDFFAIKKQYFTQTHPVEHYAIFGWLSGTADATNDGACSSDNLSSPPAFGQTGEAEIGGANFVISLGNARMEGLTGDKLHFDEATTFMHELGHNLGLRHGGDEDSTDKPNYLSVMNYLYQFSGILQADGIGSNVPDFARTRMDYSSQVLPVGGNTPGALNSDDLNELAGLGSGTADVFAFSDGKCGFQLAPSNGPVDWDGDGAATNPHAEIDDLTPSEHGEFACSRPFHQILHGFDDWSAIRAYLLAAATCPNSGSDEVAVDAPVTLDAHGRPHAVLAPMPQRGRQGSGTKRVREHAPMITGIAPNPLTLSQTQSGTITITGKSLCAASVVTLTGGLALYAQSQPDGSVTAQIPDLLQQPHHAESGPIALQAFNGVAMSAQSLLIAPSIAGFFPSAAPVGATVTIRGAALLQPPGITAPTTVSFGGNCAANATGDLAGDLAVVVPACANGGPLIVTTAVGSATSTGSLGLLPGITGISPTQAMVGDVITITGTHLADSATDAPTVTFRFCPTAVPALANGDGSLRFVAPDCLGSGPILVTNALGTGESASSLTITPLLITGFSPTSAPAGATLVISFRSTLPTGSIQSVNFPGITGDAYGTILAQDATSVTVVIPSGAQSGVVTLRLNNGRIVTSDQIFIVTPPSVAIAGFSPASGPVGTSVTISGTQLVSATGQRVTFSGCAAGVDAAANADGSVTVIVPSCAATGPLTLSNGIGNATSVQIFTVTP